MKFTLWTDKHATTTKLALALATLAMTTSIAVISHTGCSNQASDQGPDEPNHTPRTESDRLSASPHEATPKSQSDNVPNIEPMPDSETEVSVSVEVQPLASHEHLRQVAQDKLRAGLGNTEPALRLDSCELLRELRDDDWIPDLATRSLKDSEGRLRACLVALLGELGRPESRPVLEALYRQVAQPIKPWLAQSLYRLGNNRARRWLRRLARKAPPDIRFIAAVLLAEVSHSGDRRTLRAVQRVHTQWVKGEIAHQHSGVALLAARARLGDREARELLYRCLDTNNESSLLAATEALIRLGDDQGEDQLLAIVDNGSSPNRVIAAALLLRLGTYTGEQLLMQSLRSNNPDHRRIAVRSLGAIRGTESLGTLHKLLGDDDRRVQLAAAFGILSILGLEPAVLQESVNDWVEHALASNNWASKVAVARLSSDLPEPDAIDVLSRVSFDADPRVRIAAARAAGRLEGSASAASTVADALSADTVPEVREEQIRALASIGTDIAIETLTTVAGVDSREGVLAFGSLIKLGDGDHIVRLQEAYANGRRAIRLAVMEAAILASTDLVVSLLVHGLDDRVFDVRFMAARGLQHYREISERVVTTLRDGLERGETFAAHAMRSLVALGEMQSDEWSLRAVLQSRDDVHARRALTPTLGELQFEQALPLLRMASYDPDVEVRSAVVAALAEQAHQEAHRPQATRILQKLIHDQAPPVRYAARAQLAKFSKEVLPPRQAAAAEDADSAKDDLAAEPTRHEEALTEAQAEHEAFNEVHTELLKSVTAIGKQTSRRARTDREVEEVERLGQILDTQLEDLRAALGRATGASARVRLTATSAGVGDDERVKEIRAQRRQRKTQLRTAIAQVKEAQILVKRWLADESGRCETSLAAADSALMSRDLRETRRRLRAAAGTCDGERKARIDYLYGRYYDARAQATNKKRARARSLRKAKEHYQRFSAAGKSDYELEHSQQRIEAIEEAQNTAAR